MSTVPRGDRRPPPRRRGARPLARHQPRRRPRRRTASTTPTCSTPGTARRRRWATCSPRWSPGRDHAAPGPTTPLAGPGAGLAGRGPRPGTRAELDGLLDGRRPRPALHDRFDERLQFGTAGLRGAAGRRAQPHEPGAGAPGHRGRGGLAAARRAPPGRWSSAATPGTAAPSSRPTPPPCWPAPGWRCAACRDPLPTPVLAFAVRHLGAAAGIMITASHNPPQDNGYKLYLGDGAQIVPPVDDGDLAPRSTRSARWPTIPLATEGIVEVGRRAGRRLRRRRGRRCCGPTGRATCALVYTAMHGVGAGVARRAFAAAGFPALVEVAEQAEPDPDFPTVAFPNPEEPGALDLALALAAAAGADVVLANDPDADRLAVAVPDGAGRRAGGRSPATSSAALLADHLLRTTAARRRRPRRHHRRVVAAARPRSREAAGVAYAEVLTGFKWVVRAPARRASASCSATRRRSATASAASCATRTASPPALVAAELVAELRAEGGTLPGPARRPAPPPRRPRHRGRGRGGSTGADWLDRVTAAMAGRAGHAAHRAGRAGRSTDGRGPAAGPPPAAVRRPDLDRRRAAASWSGPSGTEPKLKCYAEAVVPVGDGDDLGRRPGRRPHALVDAAARRRRPPCWRPRAVARRIRWLRRCRTGGRRRRRGRGRCRPAR